MTSAGLAAVVLAVAAYALGAQPPERSREVEVPGFGLMLKAGWQLLVREGCRFAVPLSWHPDADEAFVRAPDGTSLSVQMVKVVNWSSYKADLHSTYNRAKVHEDTARRLWLELNDGPRVEHFIAVDDGATACAGWLETRSGATETPRDTVKRIADSIGLAPGS